jgi:hypothetical protein
MVSISLASFGQQHPIHKHIKRNIQIAQHYQSHH